MPTTTELKTAFKHCGLWRAGWTYERAINTPALAIAIKATADAEKKRSQQSGKSVPEQFELI